MAWASVAGIGAFAVGWGILRAAALIPVIAGITWAIATVIGLGAIAVTDHNVFGGALEAVERRRVRALTTPSEPSSGDRTRGRSFWRRVVLPLLARLTRPVARIAPNSIADGVRDKLAQAGEPLGMDPAGEM